MTATRDLDDSGLDVANVLDWNGRSRRVRKPAPLTYWDEFVATDSWYIKELTSDIPEDEYDAAFNDEDWSEGVESEELSDEDDDENGSDCIDEGGDSISTESPTVETSSSDDTSDDDDASDDASSDGGSEEEPAPSKRQRRS